MAPISVFPDVIFPFPREQFHPYVQDRRRNLPIADVRLAQESRFIPRKESQLRPSAPVNVVPAAVDGGNRP